MIERLSNPNNLSVKFGNVQVTTKKLGRPQNSKNLPKFIHNISATLARSKADKQENIAKNLGMLQETVSNTKRGIIKVDEEEIDKNLTSYRDKALTKLMLSLDAMTPDKIANAKIGILATVAAGMSKVVLNLTPKVADTGNKLEVIFHSPVQKSEEDFEVIEVSKAS